MSHKGSIERVTSEHRLQQVGQIAYALDEPNTRILTAMYNTGPRNLTEIARVIHMSPAIVRARVRMLEAQFGAISIANIDHYKIGLKKCITLAESAPGMEDHLTEALAVPNYWKTITRCTGGFTHYALHAVPQQHYQEFEKYMERVREAGLALAQKTIWVSDYSYVFPNFQMYDPDLQAWSFKWDMWAKQVLEKEHLKRVKEPTEYSMRADKTDLTILADLEINGRSSFAEISKFTGTTPREVRRRYDTRIMPRWLIREFVICAFLYPPGLADMYEVSISFHNDVDMDAFFGASRSMFPVYRAVKVLDENTLSARVNTPHTESDKFFAMMSALVKAGMVDDFSAVKINLGAQNRQSISTEQFDDATGWNYNAARHLETLDRITSSAKANR